MYDQKNIPKDLPGKEINLSKAVIDIRLKFALWKDYSEWLDPKLQSVYWYDSNTVVQSKVSVNVGINNSVFFTHQFRDFETLQIQHVIEDSEPNQLDLTIAIANFANLPIRDNTGHFVCGLIQIESIKFQNVEVISLLENTNFGQDVKIILPFRCPVYKWLVSQWPILYPKLQHIIPIADIEKYNRENLKFR
jgi:hypothetical protein